MSTFLHIVSDYGTQDPAFGEVLQRLQPQVAQLNPYIHLTSVDFSDTVAGGFWLYQYLLGSGADSMFAYSNIAPRRTQHKAMTHNEGEGFKYAKLKNGAQVLAVNAGNVFSFIKPYIKEFRDITVSNEGTQFRSRDNYVNCVAQVMQGDLSVLGEKLPLRFIPDAPKNVIAWIDGYGNIKTSIRRSSVNYKPGAHLRVEINGVIWTARMVDGSFSVNHGELAFAPGSSGYEDPFMEIFLRRHIVRDVSAADVFNHPICGDSVVITQD